MVSWQPLGSGMGKATMRVRWMVAILLVSLLAAAGCGWFEPEPLLETDFEADPVAAGWTLAAPPGAVAEGAWADGGAAGSRCLLVRAGYWESPPAPVEPLAYYRVRFRSQATGRGRWSAVFTDADGDPLAAACLDSIYAPTHWDATEVCIRAHAEAVEVRLRFEATGTPVAIDDVELVPAGADEVAEWADAVYATLPPLAYEPPADRHRHLPRTMAALAAGEPLRVVVLGDSIANDLSHSLFEVLVARRWPGAAMRVVTSVRGGAGCEFYREGDRLRESVLRHGPDLVIIAGISHGCDAEAVRDCVRQIRAAGDADVWVLSGAVCSLERMREDMLRRTGLPEAVVAEVFRGWPESLAAMCAEEKVEYLDLRGAWEAYLAGSPRPRAWYQRDAVHANTRGKQVLGRILAAYLAPVEPDPQS